MQPHVDRFTCCQFRWTDDQCDKMVRWRSSVTSFSVCHTDRRHLCTAWWVWGTASRGSVSDSGDLLYIFSVLSVFFSVVHVFVLYDTTFVVNKRMYKMSHVAWSVSVSVCLYVGHMDVLSKTSWTDQDTVCGLTHVHPKNRVLDGVNIGRNHSQPRGVTSLRCGLLPSYFGHLISSLWLLRVCIEVTEDSLITAGHRLFGWPSELTYAID